MVEVDGTQPEIKLSEVLSPLDCVLDIYLLCEEQPPKTARRLQGCRLSAVDWPWTVSWSWRRS